MVRIIQGQYDNNRTGRVVSGGGMEVKTRTQAKNNKKMLFTRTTVQLRWPGVQLCGDDRSSQKVGTQIKDGRQTKLETKLRHFTHTCGSQTVPSNNPDFLTHSISSWQPCRHLFSHRSCRACCLFPPRRLGSGGRRRRAPPLQLLHVRHHDVRPVVVQRRHHVIP